MQRFSQAKAKSTSFTHARVNRDAATRSRGEDAYGFPCLLRQRRVPWRGVGSTTRGGGRAGDDGSGQHGAQP